MINSVLIFLSQWNQIPCKLKIFSICLCLSRLLFGLPFCVNIFINVLSYASIIFLYLLITKVKSYTVNTLLAVCSKLIYSILIDTICYYTFPQIHLSYSFFSYILSGLIFNVKSVLLNVFIMLLVLLIANYNKLKEHIMGNFTNLKAQKFLKS